MILNSYLLTKETGSSCLLISLHTKMLVKKFCLFSCYFHKKQPFSHRSGSGWTRSEYSASAPPADWAPVKAVPICPIRDRPPDTAKSAWSAQYHWPDHVSHKTHSESWRHVPACGRKTATNSNYTWWAKNHPSRSSITKHRATTTRSSASAPTAPNSCLTGIRKGRCCAGFAGSSSLFLGIWFSGGSLKG